jgi:predicted TIM-barrel fold metal-dependent hydrolase
MDSIDAHHHLWDLSTNHYPWLLDPKTPRIYGDHSPICRSYTLADFRRDVGTRPIVKSVHVQADHDFADPVRETSWLQSASAGDPSGFPNAIVAFADLARDDAEAVLDAHCRFPNMRGIRQALQRSVTDPTHPDLLRDPRWRSNLALLGKRKLSFDLQVLPVQMADAAALTREHPQVQFILCHLGLPMDQSAEGRGSWRLGMRELARSPNIAVKISGFGMFDRKWSVQSIAPLVLETIEIFGAERAMFGSNFPVDGMMASYDRIWSAFEAITSGFSEKEQSALFHDNAARLYRI